MQRYHSQVSRTPFILSTVACCSKLGYAVLALFDPPKTRVFPRAAPILDFIWYPRATPRDASSFCFVASVRESPVQLLDASNGRVSNF
jgi:hypothetical protein